MIEENVAEQMSKPNVPNRVKEEVRTYSLKMVIFLGTNA